MNISKTYTYEYSEDQAKRWLSWLAWYMTRNNQDVFRIRDLLKMARFKQSGDDSRLFKFTHALVLELLRNLIFGLTLGLGFVINFGWKFGLILGLILGPIYYVFREFTFLVIFGLENNIWRKKWGSYIWTKDWITHNWHVVENYPYNVTEDAKRKAKILLYIGRLITTLIDLGGYVSIVVSLIYWNFRSYGLNALLIGILITLGMFFLLRDLEKGIYLNYDYYRRQWSDKLDKHNWVLILRWYWKDAIRGGVMLSCVFGLVFAPCFWLIFWLGGRLIVPLGSTLLSFVLILMPIGGLMGAVFSGFTLSHTHTYDSYRHRLHQYLVHARNAAYGGSVFMLSFGLIFVMTLGLKDGLVGGLFAGLAGFLRFDNFNLIRIFLETVFKYLSGLLSLFIRGYIPFNYTRFLNYAVDRLILQKVGDDGYRFIHRMLREHFAEMYEWEKKS